MAFLLFVLAAVAGVVLFILACIAFATPAVLFGRLVEWFFDRRGR